MNTFEIIFGNALIVLFFVVGLGLLLGNLTIKGIGLGSSGVLFVALLAGHLGMEIPDGVGSFGLVLFVYCVGIGAGPRFFPALAREGGGLAKLSLVIVAVGAITAWGLGRFFELPTDLTAGLFAGALTSTPALAAASEGTKVSAEGVAIGYGIAYPFGVIGVVLFVQLLPKLLKPKEAEEEIEKDSEAEEVRHLLVEVSNSNLVGMKIGDENLSRFGCQVSRVMKEGRLVPLNSEDEFCLGQNLMLVGRARDIRLATDFIGKKSEASFVMDTESERDRLVVSSKDVGGKLLQEIGTLRNFGVVVTRIERLGQTFVPTPETRIEVNDVLTSVGQSDGLKRLGAMIGHRPQAFDQTDMISLAVGLSLGIFCGMVPIALPGGNPMTLGLAGGPLFVSLVLGYFGRVGRVVGYIPRPTRLLLQELGLVLFLANAGIVGGASLGETVSKYGATVFLTGGLITLLPLLIAYIFARKGLGLTQPQTLGGICGGMTSTPALGALTASSNSQQPIVSYATAYPVALIMMTVLAKILIQVMGVSEASGM
ncbi:TrkA C-terminal domain-containing protein [Pelagicoccus sp. SDUM812002]|uniref:aspartate:alanine exchanger family transporter n=1 Tax=Pelagicoccus sp. SDUM812002 TaxID=3041266 RepID=UPI00280DB2F3|nr:TrkA C-terminal domain-containing protein [Pelagicoccus sp. SDUM812002]MDQ8186151.1 TrkA C-terminal domain-containing protein [Pelagicoccus sp. SDUM812002]